MKTKFRQLMEEDLLRVRNGLLKKNITKSLEKVHQRIGRIKEKYKRIAGLYKIEVVPNRSTKKAEYINWEISPQKRKKRESTEMER